MDQLEKFVKNKEWGHLAFTYYPSDVVSHFNFKGCLKIAYEMLYNEEWETHLQEYAVSLLYEIKKKFQEEWNKSWRNEAFLGVACDITLKYDERYKAFKQAMRMAEVPPPELLIELAGCCIAPGIPPISYDEALNLLELAIKDYPYVDAIGLMQSISFSKKDFEKEAYYASLLRSIEKIGKKSKPLEPSFLWEKNT